MVRSPACAGWEKRDQSRGALRRSTPVSPLVERKANLSTKSSKPRCVASHPPPEASQDQSNSPLSPRHCAGPCMRHPVRLVPSKSDIGAVPVARARLLCSALAAGGEDPCFSLAPAFKKGNHAPAVEASARNCLRFGFIPFSPSSYPAIRLNYSYSHAISGNATPAMIEKQQVPAEPRQNR